MKTKTKKQVPYHMVRFGKLIEEFQSEAAHFTHVMTNGAGIRTLGMLDTIRKLEQLYLQVGCHLDAARSVSGGEKITLDDALDAIEIVRQMEQEETAEMGN